MFHAVIMAGGAGTRFWPASRKLMPKQLLDLVGGQTMLQATVSRLQPLISSEQVLIVTNQSLVEPIAAQLPDLPAGAVLGEPCKRDTAPCVGLAAALIARRDPDAVMMVTPADHVIEPTSAFQEAARRALALVESQPEALVTFGIPPTYPAESFGYIERGEPVDGSPEGTYRVVKFREKPSRTVAEQYLATGDFYWNSGIFVWRAATILEALERYEPEMFGHLAAIAEAAGRADFQTVLDTEFNAIRGKSIDYAVMEHYPTVHVIEAPFEWDDLGSWGALPRMLGQDAQANTLVGRVLALNTRNTLVRTDHEHLVVTVGLNDLIVVHTSDATLVAHKDEEESIRKVVEQIQQNQWHQYL